MLLLQCSACKEIIENEIHFSFVLNCEKVDDDESITIITSHELITLCSDCIDKISVAKFLSYPARLFDNDAHHGFEKLKEVLNNAK